MKKILCSFQSVDDRLKSFFDKDFKKADKLMLVIILINWVLGSFLYSIYYSTFIFGFISSTLLLGLNFLVYRKKRGTLTFRIVVAISLVLFSILFIQQQQGLIQTHFHFFITLSILAIYKDIIPTIVAFSSIAIYHIVFNYLQLSATTIDILNIEILFFDKAQSVDFLLYHIFLIFINSLITSYIICLRVKRFVDIKVAKLNLKDLNDKLEKRVEKELESRIKREISVLKQTTDSLTKLQNREKLIEDIIVAKKPKLAILDIDRFKEVNEYYGHKIGDQILINSAEMIRAKAHYSINLYRLAGDEFALLAFENISKDEFIDLNESIVEEFDNHIFNIDENEFNVTITAGVAFEKEDLYIHAEMAMKNGKEKNHNLNFYDDSVDIQKQHENNIKWTKKLKDAIKDDRIIPFIQPIINNKTGNIEKYESLVRLRDTNGNIEPPFYFLEIAKKARQYPSITQRVVSKSIEFFADKNVEFSVNLTIEDILNKDTRAYLKEQLSNYNISNRVVLEIVESEGIENFDDVSQFIKEMKGIGCKIAIDDFGTGYSNFDYLMKLNVDYVKIDGSMIKNIDTDENAQLVIKLIVEFAQKLNIKTIAEFVHSEAVYNKVKEMGIDYSQGFHLGKPQTIDNFDEVNNYTI